jgi:hypothetical protein
VVKPKSRRVIRKTRRLQAAVDGLSKEELWSPWLGIGVKCTLRQRKISRVLPWSSPSVQECSQAAGAAQLKMWKVRSKVGGIVLRFLRGVVPRHPSSCRYARRHFSGFLHWYSLVVGFIDGRGFLYQHFLWR